MQEVFASNNCLLCHASNNFASNGGDLNLETGNVGQRMLNLPSSHGGVSCQDELLIDQMNPANSLLLKLVDGDLLTALNKTDCKRNAMPPGGTTMSGQDNQCLTAWVEMIAATETPINTGSVSADFEPASAEQALTKAKYLLHGAAPTEAELDSVGGANGTLDEAALRDLIREWEGTPAYAKKMKSFMGLVLQQNTGFRPVYAAQFSNLLGRKGRPGTKLTDNFEEMFVRKAWDIYKDDGDWRDIITSRTWPVTTGVLAALAFSDRWHQEQDDEDQSFRKTGDAKLLRDDMFKDADFGDWRYVTLKQGSKPTEYDGTNAFVDKMRDIPDGGNFTLKYPRVGFFSSPAFHENWETNENNQFRVTMQQTLIVALGLTFDPSDATAHLTEDGIPQDHADPSSSCYQCHRHMDPMRLVFQNFQVIESRARKTTPDLQPSFSFFGVSQNFDTVDEFADILANHPKLPAGWVQKLCVWGNSQRCVESDPEFQDLANEFAKGYNLKKLVRNFVSSPLFTGSRLTDTHEENEFFISFTRANHFCHAMTERIGALKEIYGSTGDRADNFCNDVRGGFRLNSIEPDSFDRANPDFIQARTPSLFAVKSIDKACMDQEENVIVRNRNDRVFIASDGEDKAIKLMVEHIMALPPNHSRHDDAVDTLTRIYDIATNPNECSGDPADQGEEIRCGYGKDRPAGLRSVWFAACSSADAVSFGL